MVHKKSEILSVHGHKVLHGPEDDSLSLSYCKSATSY